MDSNQMTYFIGIVVGFLVLAVWMLIRRNADGEYDERQMLVRGRAYQYGFATLVFYNLIYGAAYMYSVPDWCDNMVGMLIGVLLSLAVFCGYCIWKDAYMNLNQSPGFVYFIFGALGVVNLLLGIISLKTGEFFENGKVSFRAASLFLGVIFLLFFFLFWLKNHGNRAEEE